MQSTKINSTNTPIVLSNYGNDVGHMSCYQPNTNTKIESEIINTNKQNIQSYLYKNDECKIQKDLSQTLNVKGNYKTRTETEGNYQQECICKENINKVYICDGDFKTTQHRNKNVTDTLIVKGNYNFQGETK